MLCYVREIVVPSTYRRKTTMGTCTWSSNDTERSPNNPSVAIEQSLPFGLGHFAVLARISVSCKGIPPHLPELGEQHQRYP
jgi:hypothetical protein